LTFTLKLFYPYPYYCSKKFFSCNFLGCFI